jgi:hypothetical protein
MELPHRAETTWENAEILTVCARTIGNPTAPYSRLATLKQRDGPRHWEESYDNQQA